MKNFLKAMSHTIIHNARLRRDRNALHQLPDALLADMGISRSLIDHYTSPKALVGRSSLDR